MKILILNKPKKTILNILYIFSLLMIAISIVAIVTLMLMREYPQHIESIDDSIPSFYEKKILSIYKKAKESPTELEQYKNFNLLYEELDNHISVMSKYYKKYREAQEFIINYLVKNNQLEKALELSKTYENEYPYDFFAKFQYAKVLGLADKLKARTYLEQLYKKHRDIFEVHNALQSFYLENGLIKEAIVMENENSLMNPVKTFTAYFVDQNKQHKQIILRDYDSYDYMSANGVVKYFINFQHDFKKLNGLRLDFDGFRMGQAFEVLSMTLGTKEQKYQDIKIDKFNHIIKIDDKRFVISNNDHLDPFLILSLPDDLHDYTGVVDLNASIVFQKPPGPMDTFYNNNEWQFFYSESPDFKESKSKKLEFSLGSDNFLKANSRFDHAEKSQFVRLDIPSYDGLKFKNINILINDSTKLSESDVNQMHSIMKTNEGIVVKGNDPYLIYKLGKKETVNKISVRIDL